MSNDREVEDDSIDNDTDLAESSTSAAIVESSSDDDAHVLARRARRLAHRGNLEGDKGETTEILVFTIGKQCFGIETRYVCEIRHVVDFTPLPGAPDWFVGITTLRGEFLPFVDLRKLIDTKVQGLANFPLVIVLGHEGAEFGILADATLDVQRLRADQILDPRSSNGDTASSLCSGVTEDATILLDGELLLQDERLVVDQSSVG